MPTDLTTIDYSLYLWRIRWYSATESISIVRVKCQRWIGKVMTTTAWDTCAIVRLQFPPPAIFSYISTVCLIYVSATSNPSSNYVKSRELTCKTTAEQSTTDEYWIFSAAGRLRPRPYFQTRPRVLHLQYPSFLREVNASYYSDDAMLRHRRQLAS